MWNSVPDWDFCQGITSIITKWPHEDAGERNLVGSAVLLKYSKLLTEGFEVWGILA